MNSTASPIVILVVEDEQPLRKFLRVTLQTQDYRVVEVTTGEEALKQAALSRPDLIILDLGLPDMDGVQVAARLREWSSTPIIVVSARGKEQDKVVALDAGADDYLTKPFGVAELLARVRAALRRRASADAQTGDPVFKVGGLEVDLGQRLVKVDATPVHLTPNEFRLLTLLVKNAGRVLTHRQILQEIWGPDCAESTHYLRVYMNQLRQKLEKDPAQPEFLLTEPGVGYRLVCET